jgi:hypothetical protein
MSLGVQVNFGLPGQQASGQLLISEALTDCGRRDDSEPAAVVVLALVEAVCLLVYIGLQVLGSTWV